MFTTIDCSYLLHLAGENNNHQQVLAILKTVLHSSQKQTIVHTHRPSDLAWTLSKRPSATPLPYNSFVLSWHTGQWHSVRVLASIRLFYSESESYSS